VAGADAGAVVGVDDGVVWEYGWRNSPTIPIMI